MKLFVDSANLTEIDDAFRHGLVSGVTTNPSLLAKEERTDFGRHIRKIVELLERYGRPPLSVEVFTDNPQEMLRQASAFLKDFDYPGLSVKIPVGWRELAVIRELALQGVLVNCTCCMAYNQAVAAALAGARYVSLFWGRIRDTGYDAANVVRHVCASLSGWRNPTVPFSELQSGVEIIVGSIRHIMDVNEALQAGADIVTVPPKFLPLLTQHPKTDEAVRQFLSDFNAWRT